MESHKMNQEFGFQVVGIQYFFCHPHIRNLKMKMYGQNEFQLHSMDDIGFKSKLIRQINLTQKDSMMSIQDVPEEYKKQI